MLWFGLGGALMAMAFLIMISLAKIGVYGILIGSLMFFGAGMVISKGIWGFEKREDYRSPIERYIRAPVHNPHDYARSVEIALPNELKVAFQRINERGG